MRINKVAGYRAMLSYTQKDMADLLGISPQAYSKKERGKVPFSDKEKIMIRDTVSLYFPTVTIDEIFFCDRGIKKCQYSVPGN